MYIIVGLGNPEKKYDGTRHNIGFSVIDKLSDKFGIEVDTKKHKALCGKGIIAGRKVLLAKPQTYMNLSGESVRAICDFYSEDPKDKLIVIYDDISLEVGQLRLRAKGSAGGHNGIKSIIAHIGSEEFKRIKFGVGAKPNGWDLADYVLGRFDLADQKFVEEGCVNAVNAVESLVSEGLAEAMNKYNGSKNK